MNSVEHSPLDFIDREAGEIMRLVASVCLSVCLSVRALLFEHKSALKSHHRVFISRSIQNRGALKMVVVPTGCAFAVDHAFN